MKKILHGGRVNNTHSLFMSIINFYEDSNLSTDTDIKQAIDKLRVVTHTLNQQLGSHTVKSTAYELCLEAKNKLSVLYNAVKGQSYFPDPAICASAIAALQIIRPHYKAVINKGIAKSMSTFESFINEWEKPNVQAETSQLMAISPLYTEFKSSAEKFKNDRAIYLEQQGIEKAKPSASILCKQGSEIVNKALINLLNGKLYLNYDKYIHFAAAVRQAISNYNQMIIQKRKR